jgi:hypothetical protein
VADSNQTQNGDNMAKLIKTRKGERTTQKVLSRGELSVHHYPSSEIVALLVTDIDDPKTTHSIQVVTSELVTMLQQLKLIGHN